MASGIKKVVFFILIMISMHVPVTVFSAELLTGGDFENGAEEWSGGAADENAAFSGSFGYALCNPFGEVSDSLITHVLEYNGRVSLEKGKIYTLSGRVMNPCAETSGKPHASVSRAEGSDTVIVKVSGSGSKYNLFSVRFYSSETRECNLSFQFEKGDESIGFFVDDISLSESGTVPSSLRLRGQEKVLIPASGSSKIRYTPTLYDSEGAEVRFLRPGELYSTASDCEGTAYNPSDFTLTVSENAKSGSTVRVDCALDTSAELSPASISVELTDNLIENADFEAAPPSDYWTGSSSVGAYADSGGNTWLTADTDGYEGGSYYTTLTYNTPQLLVGGAVYVLHMTARSTAPEASSSVIQNSASESDGTVYFNISNISSEKKSITAAFSPESSGIYNIVLNIRQRYDCTVYIDDVRLCSEILRPAFVSLHAPGNIALPDIDTTYTLSAFVRDQLGNVIDGAECALSFEPSEGLLSSSQAAVFPEFDESSGTLSVFPDTAEGEYVFRAVFYGDDTVAGEVTVVISSDYIGDGGFEKKAVNEWWMASSPSGCSFAINDDGSSKYAQVTCDDSYFMLLNNSYMRLIENYAYVFTADISASSDVTVTAFLEDTDGGLSPLAQFEAGAKRSVTELFLAENSAVGRLILYFQSDSGAPFSVSLDNVALKKAIVSVSGASMSGNFSVNGSAEADFSFFNNVSGNSDASACVITWFVSDSAAGEYAPLSTRGKYIYFDTDFAGKYVLFEVAPICALTGFTGTPVRCMPQYITFDGGGGSSDAPFVKPKPDEPETPVFKPVKLGNASDAGFDDIRSHWAEEYIGLLKNAGIVNGRSETAFEPESAVLRCEFAKMLSIALGLSAAPQKCSFTDVSEESLYRGYIGALFSAGIVSGVSEESFEPNRTITRSEAAVMIMRAYEKCSLENAAVSSFRFYDSDFIPEWAKKAVGQSVELGIINGTDAGLFLPSAQITRAETAAVICRLLGKLEEVF